MVSGDGTVAVTQVFRQPRGLLVDSFDSKEDLINALHTSCFIPGYRFAVSKPKSAIVSFALMFSLLCLGRIFVGTSIASGPHWRKLGKIRKLVLSWRLLCSV
jgi:hypothetical protein